MDYTTELSAVNSMLATIGEAPINTLEDLGVVDAVTARSTLAEVTRSVLVEGWTFNTDLDYPFAPEGFAPFEIKLPPNAMSVLTVPDYEHIIARGNRLYDRTRRSYNFKDHPPVPCEVVWSMSFSELPEATRQYVFIRAARIFQSRALGSDKIHMITEAEERQARWNHRKMNVRVRRRRYLQDSATISLILGNR